MPKVLAAKGFRDFTPAQKRRKERLIARIRDRYLRYGFEEIETPAAEPIEHLRGSEGGENLTLIFEIMRRGLTDQDLNKKNALDDIADLGLRYDLTVPLARYYASNRATLPAVFKSIQIGPVWRAEKPQKGRYRQFTQCDIDILGESSFIAEVELILATLEALADAGLPGATAKLNDRRLLDAALDEAGLTSSEKSRALIMIDKIDKIGLDMVLTLLSEAFGDRYEKLADLLKGSSQSPTPELEQIMSAVRAVAGADSISFDPTLVRGMGYYTGPIFEVRHPASPGSVAGGGRYDNMVGKFVGEKVPACGFSIGLDRLMEIAPDEEVASTEETFEKVALMFDDADDLSDVLARHTQLLESGKTVRLVRSPRNKQRLFDDLKRAGYQGVQRLRDEVFFFREL